MNQLDSLIARLPEPYRSWLLHSRPQLTHATELRFHAGRHVAVSCGGGIVFVDEQGISTAPRADTAVVEQRALVEIVSALCEYSVFSHSESLREGFLTIAGGHRVGVCASVNRQGAADLGSVSSVNIRVANERIGCASNLIQVLGTAPRSVLLCGPPLSGKTTVLRDFARQVSDAPHYRKCTVIDERGELAAMYGGLSPFQLGECTDVLDRFSRRKAFDVALRTLSPDIIVCDELGAQEDCALLVACGRSGVRLASSVHASNLTELRAKSGVWQAVESGLFDAVVFLHGAPRIGEIKKIYEVV